MANVYLTINCRFAGPGLVSDLVRRDMDANKTVNTVSKGVEFECCYEQYEVGRTKTRNV